MKLYKVVGHVDDGYTTRDSISKLIIVAENEHEAERAFINRYNDGWGGYAYNVKAEEISLTEASIVGVLYER